MNHAFHYRCTIQTRAKKQQLFFDGGVTAFVVGQTIEGAETGAKGLIDVVVLSTGTWAGGDAAGYVVLESIDGIFVDGEDITTETGEAVTNGTNVDYEMEEGGFDYYWVDNQADTPCRFFWKNVSYRLLESGETPSKTLVLWLPGTFPVEVGENRITTTEQAFAGQYNLVAAIPVMVQSVRPHHYECTLEAV
jgi:hypothetical protein